ncbi:MAG: SusD/RagB family nutrient-binding outer membrane lipoprotein [Gemmatimonadaceae bacterium]|nr:SusD/RagB family nutrient-binding outer membrane lipoprotein [Gemmatimonadaceae bacterium]
MRMHNLVVLAAVGLSSTACLKFTGEKLDTDPNQPIVATVDQSFVAMQAVMFSQLTSDQAMFQNVVMQQLSGNGRQWVAYDQYNQPEDFNAVGNWYTAGGLIDIRKGEDAARARNDRLYLGILQTWEAIVVGAMADIYGDIGYSTALDPAGTPATLDPQQSVYAALQALLDTAITNIAGGGVGPGARDLAYGGSAAKWGRLARTMKARLYMHTAERIPGAYALARAQALLGIASAADDFVSYQSTTVGEQNRWYEFKVGRSDDVAAGRVLVELMRTRGDPRLTEWFLPNSSNAIVGQYPWTTPRLGNEPDPSWLTDAIAGPDAPMPIVTWAENKLIEAEAAYRGNDETAARAALNAVRATVPLPNVTLLVTGPALLTAIMEEKYVATFRTLESWNDYKRTCYPNITPTAGKTNVLTRLPYGSQERAANPNVPDLGAQPVRNWNDPVTATSTNGAACIGQR